jgi:hypothetical protein
MLAPGRSIDLYPSDGAVLLCSHAPAALLLACLAHVVRVVCLQQQGTIAATTRNTMNIYTATTKEQQLQYWDETIEIP